MANILLMSPAYLKRNSLIDENVDEGYITPVIEICQDQFVQEILGTDLYNEIKGQIQTPPLSALNETLLNEKVLPAMRWWVLSKLVKPLTYKFGNMGVKQIETENHVTPSIDELNFLVEEYMNRAEYYANAATLYLIENSNDYPLYCNGNDQIDEVKPRRNQYRSGIFLGGVHGKKRHDKWVDIDYGDRNNVI